MSSVTMTVMSITLIGASIQKKKLIYEMSFVGGEIIFYMKLLRCTRACHLPLQRPRLYLEALNNQDLPDFRSCNRSTLRHRTSRRCSSTKKCLCMSQSCCILLVRKRHIPRLLRYNHSSQGHMSRSCSDTRRQFRSAKYRRSNS